ncbi:MAG TPA: glycosyltransferase family 2 protein [Candidatus Anoxymicrobiaceae bacterium]
MNEVAAVIINRNTREFLRACLQTLQAQDFSGGISIWVVDNGSTDGSPQMVLGEFPEANLVWNDANVGYSKACNQGIGNTREPYVFIMNSDTALSSDTVSHLVSYLERNPECGLAAPLLRNSDGSLQYSCRDFPSITTAFVHAFVGLIKGENRRSAGYKKMTWDHEQEAQVDWVSGAFMAGRREALDEIGGFDEGYFMYVEDVDLCWRLWQAGWSVGFVPRGEVYHHIGMASRAVPARMVFHHHRSMLRFHCKTYQGPARPLVNALVAIGVASRLALIMALNAYYRLRSALGGAAKVIMPGRQ